MVGIQFKYKRVKNMKKQSLILPVLLLTMVLPLGACTDPKQPDTPAPPSTNQPQTSVEIPDEEQYPPVTEDAELAMAKRLFTEASDMILCYEMFDTVSVMPYSDEAVLGQTEEIDGVAYIDTGIAYDEVVQYLDSVFSGQILEDFLNKYFRNIDGIAYAAQGEKMSGDLMAIADISIRKRETRDDGTDFIAVYNMVIEKRILPLKSLFTVSKGEEGSETISYMDFFAYDNVAVRTYESDEYIAAPTGEELTESFDRCSDVLWTYATQGADVGFSNDFPDMPDLYKLPKTEIYGTFYIMTDLDYQTAVDKYSQIFAGEQLEKFMHTYFYNGDGKLYIGLVGGSSGFDTIEPEFIYLGQNDGMLYYIASYTLVLSSDMYVDYYHHNNVMSVVMEEDGCKLADGGNIWWMA